MTDPESPQTLPTAADRTLAAEAARAVQAAYAALPKTGKPQPHEHTVLAGIVAYTAAIDDSQQHQHQKQMRVVAIGTGTKCLGGSKRSPAGDLLNDSHAEVIARRAFVAWVYQQLHHATQQPQPQDTPGPPATETQPSPDSNLPACQPPARGHTAPAGSNIKGQPPAFSWSPQAGKFVLRPGVLFAMYVSQPPCGDASIFGAAAGAGSQQAQEEEAPPVDASTAAAAGQQQQPVGRTGAKVLRPLGAADVAQASAAAAAAQQEQVAAVVPSVPTAQDVEAGPQLLGVLRRKPGKGDPTLSLSCSDKLARWACLGLQGCLLSSLLQEPLYLSMLVVSVPCAGSSSSSGGQQQQPGEQGAAVGTGQQERQDGQEHQQAGLGGAAGSEAPSSCPGEGQSAQQQVQTGGAAADLLAAAEAAGRRAFGQRLVGCAGMLRPPFRLVQPKVVAVQAAEPGLGLQPDSQRVAASGTSINYTCQLPLFAAIAQQAAGKARPSSGAHEATAGAFGRKAGAARKGLAATSIKTRSRLSSAALFEQWQVLQQQMSALDGTQQEEGSESLAERVQAKTVAGAAYQDAWSRLRAPGMPFAGWIAK